MLVADTHVWIWFVANPRRLSKRAARVLELEDEIAVSVISCWELAVLVAKNRLTFDRQPLQWIKQALARPRITLLELSPEVAVLSATLHELPGDPADRIIVASALHYDVPLVTKDRRIRSFKRVATIW